MSRKAIDRAREEITAGWLGGDADAILVHITDDAMFLAPHEPPVVGKSAIRTWLNQLFSQIAMTKVEMVEDRDVFISGDLAVERSSYHWESTSVGGEERFSDHGNFIGVWQRQPDHTWQESHIIWNSTKPAA